MARLEVVPFSDEHLDGAAALLAARHAADRRVEPLLPERYEDPAAAREELELAWRAEAAYGAAATRGGRLVGYLIGAPRDPKVWGDNVWVELAGHAAEEAEDVRDLYAAAAARWVDEGRTRHYAVVPAHDASYVDGWFRLGFGQQQAHGVREVPERTDVRAPEGVEIRRPARDEIGDLIEVDLALPRHQRQSPVFSGMPEWAREELEQEWIDTLDGDEEEVLAACVEGKPVAVWSIVRPGVGAQHRGLGLPDASGFLGFASTLPEHRRTGIGVALTDASFARAAELGYRSMITDWRVTNLLSSRFWPRRGFRIFALRLYRSIP